MTPKQRLAAQRRAAKAIAEGATHDDAARAAKVGTTTLTRWKRLPEFVALVDAARPTAAGKPRRKRGTPGRPSLVLQGFRREHVAAGSTEPWWTEGTHAFRVLAALRIGATWELVGQYCRLHEATPRSWNARGAEILAKVELLDDLDQLDVDDESFACAAFHVAVLEARATPGIAALDTINRAARADWRAAERLLARLPTTRETYAEVTKAEISGPDGGPIPIASEERVALLLDRARAQREAGASPATADEGDAGDG